MSTEREPVAQAEETARCTCEWMHPMDGAVRNDWPAVLDPYCTVHGHGTPPFHALDADRRERLRERIADVLYWFESNGHVTPEKATGRILELLEADDGE